MRCIGVTGASGFVGSTLCKTFAERGWRVVALGRGTNAGYDFRHFDLAAAPAPTLLDGIDVLVHAAHDMHATATQNLQGSRDLFSAALASGVRKIVFISSMAADEGASSVYGREKYAAEQLLNTESDLIVRPGLVIGDGGLFKSMYRLASRYRVVPLFAGGRQPVYVVGIGELSNAIASLVERDAKGLYTIARSEPVSMSEIYLEIARKAGRRIFCVPLPLEPALTIVTLLERCGIRLPLESERLKGLKNLRRVCTPPDIPGMQTPPTFAALLGATEIS
jgi:nucleoside-diphosphate-sugar epimerase